MQLKLFTFYLGQVPVFLLAYSCLALGLLVGWFGHMIRVRKKRRRAEAALAQQQQAQQGREAGGQ